MACAGAHFRLFVAAALDIDLWVESVNTDANTDANIADMPSRSFSGRGEHSKITLPIAERPRIFICEIEFKDPVLFFQKWRE